MINSITLISAFRHSFRACSRDNFREISFEYPSDTAWRIIKSGLINNEQDDRKDRKCLLETSQFIGNSIFIARSIKPLLSSSLCLSRGYGQFQPQTLKS